MSISTFPSEQRMLATIETEDGQILQFVVNDCHATTGPAIRDVCISETEYTIFRDQPSEIEITFNGYLVSGELFIPRDKFVEEIEWKQQALEWRCEYCGAINSMGDRKCEGCEAYRSFILDT